MLYQNQLINGATAMTKGEHVCQKFRFLHAHAHYMSDLCSKFQVSASNTVGGFVETRTILECDMVKICMTFEGTKFCNNDLNQSSVSFMHMFNACLNCIASFKSLHQIL